VSAPPGRRVRVRVPASSANLGPGFDVLACALALHVDVEVEETGRFAVETGLAIARDRRNLCVRAFETLLPADRFTFRIRSTVPLSGGLGTSAAAIVAGLLAGEALVGGDDQGGRPVGEGGGGGGAPAVGGSRSGGDAGGAPAGGGFRPVGEGQRLLPAATRLEGHPDNVAAALLGGFVLCADGHAERFEPPQGLECLLVVPGQAVRTAKAREALPSRIPRSRRSSPRTLRHERSRFSSIGHLPAESLTCGHAARLDVLSKLARF